MASLTADIRAFVNRGVAAPVPTEIRIFDQPNPGKVGAKNIDRPVSNEFEFFVHVARFKKLVLQRTQLYNAFFGFLLCFLRLLTFGDVANDRENHGTILHLKNLRIDFHRNTVAVFGKVRLLKKHFFFTLQSFCDL